MKTNVQSPFYSPKSSWLLSQGREVNLITETKPNQGESKGETKGRAKNPWRAKKKRGKFKELGKKTEEETTSQIQEGKEG